MSFTTTVTPHAASGPGALNGHKVTCSCGTTFTTSLSEQEARRQAEEHLAWHGRQTDTPGSDTRDQDVTERTLDLNKIVATLKVQHGVEAYVEQTGGGVATIYAGEPWVETGWGKRYPALAGPGWFEGAGALASVHDFWIGPDDDGETIPPAFPLDGDEASAAASIAALVIAARSYVR